MVALTVVRAGGLKTTRMELLLVSLRGDRKMIGVEERAIAIPKIDLLLSEFYTLADLTDDRTQMMALLPYIWQGERRHLRGTLGFIGSGALLAVPFGFFAGALN